MGFNHERYPTGRIVATMGILFLGLGILIILTNQPPNLLESSSGMGNYRMPSGGYGATTSPGNSSPGAPASSGNTVATATTMVDVLIPVNEPADNSL